MIASSYVQTEAVSFLSAPDELMLIARDAGPLNAKGRVYITAVKPNSSIEIASGLGYDTDSYTPITTINFDEVGSRGSADLPITVAMTNQVTVFRVTAGAVTITIYAPQEVKAEFRTRKHP